MTAVAILLTTVILGAAPAPSMDGARHAADVYRADFEHDSDINFDGVPDGWIRRRGPGYPHFAKCELVEMDDCPSGRQCLKMELDGGAVSISSPPFELNPRFSFFLDGWVRTSKLRNNVAIARLTLLDAHDRVVLSLTTTPHAENAGWTALRIGPIAPPETATRGVITLETPYVSKQTDLRGVVWFDDLRLARLPRMTLETNSEVNLFTSLTAPEVTCRASGVAADQPEVEFQLLDSAGRVIAEQVAALQETKGGKREEASADRVFSGKASWKPPVSDYGFYRVRVTMRDQKASWLGRETTLAVFRPASNPEAGELGWSLPGVDAPLSPGALAQLLQHAGVNWVKCPVWFHGDDVARADQLALFAERLSIHRIEMIGVLDQPPAEVRQSFRERGELPAASVYVDPEVWQPVVDPVMTRLSLKVRWWQLGGDHDTSFVELPNLPDKITEIKQHLERFGQDLRLGVNWKWTHAGPSPAEGKTPCRFLTYRGEPDLTAAELGDYLDGLPRDQTLRFVQLAPVAKSQYTLPVRLQDLVARMIAAKKHQAGAVFVTKPFDDQHGLMNADGTPGELFLPWRTTALQLAGTTYLGRFQWNSGSSNFVFAKDGKATVVAWNETPVCERFYLGDDVLALDVWGKEIPVRNVEVDGVTVQEFEVGPEPIFLVGLDEFVARWRLEATFENRRLESIFGREQKLVLKTVNPYSQAVSGEVLIQAPSSWEYPKHPLRFRVSEGEELKLAIPVTLNQDTPSGPQPVKMEFRMTGRDGVRRFSVDRHISVGLEDVMLTIGTHLDEFGALQTELNFQNLTDGFVSFNCTLFPPDRRRITAQAIDLPPGRSTLKLPIPDAADLIGKRLPIRAEEIGGPRVLNSSAVAEE